MIPTENLTEIAKSLYLAYGEATGFKNYQGLPMPEWGDLTPVIQLAWEAAAFQSSILFKPTVELDAREQLQVSHALTYFAQFQASGVPGHGQFMLIAKLAKALGIR